MGLGGCFWGGRGAKMHHGLNAALGPLIAPRNRKVPSRGRFQGFIGTLTLFHSRSSLYSVFSGKNYAHKYRREVLNARGVGERDTCPFEKLRQTARYPETTTTYITSRVTDTFDLNSLQRTYYIHVSLSESNYMLQFGTATSALEIQSQRALSRRLLS